MEPLRIGFLGAGGFARHTIYPALHLAPVALQAVCDADENRAKAAAGKFGTVDTIPIGTRCLKKRIWKRS